MQSSPFPSLLLETDHQLDRFDQPAGHSRAQVSFRHYTYTITFYPLQNSRYLDRHPFFKSISHFLFPFLFLSVMSDSMIMDAIASFLVLPNRLTVPLVADLHVAQLRSPLPRVTHTHRPYTH